MLSLDKLYLISIIIVSFFSCNKSNQENKLNSYDQRNQYLIDNYQNYWSVRKAATDSVNHWLNDSLQVSAAMYLSNYEIDSILIFNKDSTCFFTSINKCSNMRSSEVDYVKDFAGFKINGKWYFTFMGISEPIVRSYWQDSVYAPLSFEELSYVAYERRFEGMVTAIMGGHPEKIDDYFKRIFPDLHDCKLYSKDKKNMCRDSIVVYRATGKYNHKMSKEEIAAIQTSIDQSKIPQGEPLIEKRSLWQKIKYGEKVFESEEWKNYLKQKYGSKWQEHL